MRLLLPGFLASCFLSGCAGGMDRQLSLAYETREGRTVSASMRWRGRESKAVLPPEDGPDTARTGFYDSDGIWRTNF